MSWVASVTMKGCRLNLATKKPFTIPISAPMATTNENRQQNPTRGNGREVGEKLPGDGAILQQRTRDGRGQADHTSAGQVGTGQDDTAGDAQRHGQ